MITSGKKPSKQNTIQLHFRKVLRWVAVCVLDGCPCVRKLSGMQACIHTPSVWINSPWMGRRTARNRRQQSSVPPETSTTPGENHIKMCLFTWLLYTIYQRSIVYEPRRTGSHKQTSFDVTEVFFWSSQPGWCKPSHPGFTALMLVGRLEALHFRKRYWRPRQPVDAILSGSLLQNKDYRKTQDIYSLISMEPGMPDGTLSISSGCIHPRVHRIWKGEAKLGRDWTNLPSITFEWTNRITYCYCNKLVA